MQGADTAREDAEMAEAIALSLAASGGGGTVGGGTATTQEDEEERQMQEALALSAEGSAARKALGIGSGIGDCVSGRIKQSGGFAWRDAPEGAVAAAPADALAWARGLLDGGDDVR